MSQRFFRAIHTSRTLQDGKVWSDFTKRSKSFGIPSTRIKEAIMTGSGTYGPPSFRRKATRVQYRTPAHIDETFKIAYDFLQNRASSKYDQIEKSSDAKEKELLAIEAELHNPEVRFNFQFNDKLENNPAVIDYTQPIYRHLGKKHWESYSQMLLMQRLETLNVIPDTLPTLVPKVEVNIKFPFSTGVNKWVQPGELLSSQSTAFQPVFKIQEFETLDTAKQMYTILIVNPDVPDLENDTYKTSLCYGLVNVKIDYNDNVVDDRKLEQSNILSDYTPPVPEKNIGKQRFSVWVFRQNNQEPIPNNMDMSTSSNFDIRKFAETNNLEAVGAHIWRSEWDSYVEQVRNLYGLDKGRIFSKVRA